MFLDQATLFSVLTLVLGTAATVTALGGLAVKEGGRFYQLTLRGFLSVAFLIGAAICGIAKEVLAERDTRALRDSLAQASRSLEEKTISLEQQVAANADLSRQLLEAEKTRKIELVERIEDGVVRLVNEGSIEPTQMELTEIVVAEAGFTLNEPGAPSVREIWRFALPAGTGDLNPYRRSERDALWAFDLGLLEAAEAKFAKDIEADLRSTLPVRVDAELRLGFRFWVCALVEAQDGFGGTYTKPISLIAHRPVTEFIRRTSSTMEHWDDCVRLEDEAEPYDTWGKGGFDAAIIQRIVEERIERIVAARND